MQATVRASRQRAKALLSHVLSGRRPSEGVTKLIYERTNSGPNLRRCKM